MSLNKSKSLRTAEKYVLQGKIPAAIDEYRKVVDADPADLTTINTLGDLYVRAGRIQDAIQNFSRIADSYRESGFTLKAIAMLKKISKLDPTNIDTAMKLANLYSQQGLFVEARQQYLQVADAYARAGQTRKALEAYQKIADLDPSNTSVRMKLGEIYTREGMIEQAHESFVMAGAEFSRRGETEPALNANLKALAIRPESRQALTAIVTIYTQQGQADRAINILCDAFEKNPGDAELLTILGRTYLSAGWMDEAERTFLSLIELDRNRYHYLLEVGRKFLQMGDIDRASEQIDGCLDVLITKREEDKAIDFLRRVLDRDGNHVGSLKRLAQIFMRIREDHNLIATLNTLVEAAMRKGDEQEAIAALKELARVEPDEPMHRQRLYNMGVKDIGEPDAPEVVRATGPLDYQSAAFDDTFIIRQISEAEILAGHGQIDHAVKMLSEILTHAPNNVQIHLKLKDIYLRAGVMDKAAAECLELSRIHRERGESSRASDYLVEAQQLNPLMEPPVTSGSDNGHADSQDFDIPLATNSGRSGGFEVREVTGGLDLTRYQTGPLSDHLGFVTSPPGETPRSAPLGSGADPGGLPDSSGPDGPGSFRYSDTLDAREGREARRPSAEAMFSSAGNLPSDTMAGVLRDELEGVDFYIAQGYVEIAHDTLDRLREEHGEHPEILARYKKLGVSAPTTRAMSPESIPAGYEDDPADAGQSAPHSGSAASGGFFLGEMPEIRMEGTPGASTGELVPLLSTEEPKAEPAEPGDFLVSIGSAPLESEHENAAPFLVHKESGTLANDVLVHLDTSDLLNDTAFDSVGTQSGALHSEHAPLPPAGTNVASAPLPPAVREEETEKVTVNPMGRFGTAELIDSIVSDMDEAFEGVSTPAPGSVIDVTGGLHRPGDEVAETEVSAPAFVQEAAGGHEPLESLEIHDATAAKAVDHELREMIEELKGNTGELKPLLDYETHYSLGLAYKDMDLLDEAIEQFQLAFRMAAIGGPEGNYIQCCHMLGVCFKLKSMHKVAVMWYQRGLKVQNRTEDEYQALRYEIGLSYQEMGELDNAIDVFTEVYGVDVNYRHVGDKLKELHALKRA